MNTSGRRKQENEKVSVQPGNKDGSQQNEQQLTQEGQPLQLK